MKTAACLICLSSALSAETPMSGAAFDAYTTGRTLSFETPGGDIFGVEAYLPGKRVIWSASPGQCTDGVWYESKGSICFRYNGDPTPKCWTVYAEGTGIRAAFTNNPTTTVIFERATQADPLICNDLSS